MVLKTVLKVDISCDKCKKKILKAVSGLPGVDKIEIDGEKGTLTITGEADPYEIIVRTKKSGKFVEVVSIGPPPAPPKKPDDKKPDDVLNLHPWHIHTPQSCPVCMYNTTGYIVHWQEPSPSCNIL